MLYLKKNIFVSTVPCLADASSRKQIKIFHLQQNTRFDKDFFHDKFIF